MAGWDPTRAGYYIELDLLAEAERVGGRPFADYFQENYVPTEPLFRLAEQTGVVLLNGGGFEGPQWSVRVSLANLDDLDYLKIGPPPQGDLHRVPQGVGADQVASLLRWSPPTACASDVSRRAVA
ncbi:hypothetical protein ABH940_002379 [Streptacidiphilus sp. BW17]